MPRCAPFPVPSLGRIFSLQSLTIVCILLLTIAPLIDACTSIIVGRKASDDGSLMTTHNNDCEDCDIRIGIVPSTKNKPDDVTPIHPCAFGFPRYVGYDRGSTYHPEALEKEKIPGEPLAVTKPLGHIPEVNYTYRYIDGTYGMMNEHGLSIGESTCGAKIVSYSVAQGGDALFDISALTRLALQRCKTSLCAIELMGSLAEKHGYYGSEDPVETGTDLFEVAGEALLIVDRETASGWVFHMLADPSGKSAIWAAQRIPDDHIAVVPNKFVIDRMNLTDTDNFRASSHIRKKAIEAGFLDKSQDAGDEAFEFSRAFALDYTNGTTSVGEQLNSAEGERRRWRVFSQLAPSRNFQPDQKERFPFSIKPDRPVSLATIQSLMRDYYAGTQFDTSQGLAAGPWHNPNRYDRNTEQQPEVRDGFFERTINIHRTSYSFVAQVHPDQPNPGVLWLAHHSPVNSIYLPIYASTRSLPSSFGTGSLFRFSRASAWWAFAAVSNNAERMFQPIHAVIAEEQKVVEEDNRNQIAKVNHQVNHMIKKGLHNQAVEVMTDFTVRRNEEIVSRWWLLNDELLGMFHDGVRLKSPRPPLELEHIFYPVDWLRQVGYFARGPLPPATYPSEISPPNHRRNASTSGNSEAAARKEANDAGKKIATEETPKPMAVMANVDSETIPISRFTNPNRTDDSTDSNDRVVSPTWYDAHAREFLIGGFSVIFLLLAIVFFLLGRWWGANHPNRSRYAEIPTVDDDQHPLATGGYDRYRRHHDTVDPGQRVVLTNR